MSPLGDDLFSPGASSTSGSLSYPNIPSSTSSSSLAGDAEGRAFSHNSIISSARNSFRAPSSRASRRAGQQASSALFPDAHPGIESIKENASSTTIDAVGDYRVRIQKTLDDRNKQYKAVGGLGVAIIDQQKELARMLKEMDQLAEGRDQREEGDEENDDVMGGRNRGDLARLAELEEKLKAFEMTSAKLYTDVEKAHGKSARSVSQSFDGLPSTALYPIPGAPGVRAPFNPLYPTTSNLPSSATTTQTQSPIPTPNVHQIIRDAQLSKDLCEGMLLEVRRLQLLLEERDAQILLVRVEKGELEKKLEPLVQQKAGLEAENRRLDEEAFSAEGRAQQAEDANLDLERRMERTDAELKRLTSTLSASRLEVETHKNEADRLASALDKLKSDHQTDLARFKGEVQQKQIQNEQLQTELEKTKKVIQDGNNRGYSASPSPSLNSPAASTPLSNRTVGRQLDDEDVFSSQPSLSQSQNSSIAFGSPSDRSYEDGEHDSSPAGRSVGSANHPTLADHLARDDTVRDLQSQLAASNAEVARLRSRPAKENFSPSSDMSDSPSLKRSGLPHDRPSQRFVSRGGIRARKSSGMMRASMSPSTLGQSVFNNDEEDNNAGDPSTPARAVTLADDLETYGGTPGTGSSSSSDSRSRRSDTDSPLQPMSRRSHAPRLASALREMSSPGSPGSLMSPIGLGTDLASEMRLADEEGDEQEDGLEGFNVSTASDESVSPQPRRANYVDVGVETTDVEEEGPLNSTPTAGSFPSIPTSTTLNLGTLTPPRPPHAPSSGHLESTPVPQRHYGSATLRTSVSPQAGRPPSPSFTEAMTTDNEGETDYEDARTTGTLTPGQRSPGGAESPYATAQSEADDFMSFGHQSSADNDSDAESIRASARPRPTGTKRSMPPPAVQVIVEKVVYKEMPLDTMRGILLSVYASKEVVRGIPAIRTEVKTVEVDRIIEVLVEKLVYHDMPADTLHKALSSILLDKQIIKGIPAVKVEVREITVEKMVEVPVERLVYQAMPIDVLRTALLAVIAGKEVVRGIPAIKTEYRDVIVEKIVEVPVEKVVYQDMPAETLSQALSAMFRDREIVRGIPAVKTVVQEKLVDKFVEVPVIQIETKWNDVPHEQLRDVFTAVFKAKEVVRDNVIILPPVIERVEVMRDVPQDALRNIFEAVFASREVVKPVHTHSVSERLVEVPIYKDVPHSVLHDVFIKFAQMKEISRPIHTHSVSVREIEVPKEVIREVEVIKEVPIPYETIKEVEIIKYVDKPVEVIKEVQLPFETIKEVEIIKYVDKPVEVIKEVQVPFETIKEVKVVEYVDRPVETVREVPRDVVREVEVIRVVQVPIETIREVEKMVDREVPVPFEVIKEIVKEVEVVRTVEVPVEVETIVEKEVRVPFETIREVEKIVEVPVEVIREVEKLVDRVIEVPVDVIREVERIVVKEIKVPFETIREVEKVVEVPVEVIRVVEKVVERIVEVPIEVIREIEKIVDREVQVPFETIREVEKIVDRPVDVIREVEKIVERVVEVPVEVIREVEKVVTNEVRVPIETIREIQVEKLVEVPVEVVREVEVIRVVEKMVEVPIEVIREVEKIIEKEVQVPFETIKEVERIVEVPVEVIKEVEVIRVIRVPVEVVREVPVDREVVKDMIVPVEIHRLPQKNASMQTDVHATQATPDMALYRVNSGNSYDFLKGPPTESTSSKRISAALARRQSKATGRSLDRTAALAVAAGSTLVVSDDHSISSSDNADSPTMTVPPPPDMPPPASLPIKRMTVVAPPRPQSSPPSSYIQRSVTPSSPFLTPAPPAQRRRDSASTPADTSGMRKPSTSSFRSAANAVDRADGPTGSTHKYHTIHSSAVVQGRDATRRRAGVITSSEPRSRQTSDNRSVAPSMVTSVRSSDYGLPHERNGWEASSGWDGVAGGSTDPAVIQAITQTMIGEFLLKSTRKAFGSAISDNKHQRFFWIHPYTRTLYWSPVDPGHEKTDESKAKSVFISNVRVQDDPGHDEEHNTWRQSLLISAASRDIRITAPSKERHLAWVTALTYLVARPSQSTMSGRTTFVPVPAASLTTPARRGGDAMEMGVHDDFGMSASVKRATLGGSASTKSYRAQIATPKNPPLRTQSALSHRRGSSTKSAGRQPSASISGKRPGTAAHEYVMQSDPEWRDGRPDQSARKHRPPISVSSETGQRSLRSMGRIQSGIEADFDRVERAEAEETGTDDYEGLDNVRGESNETVLLIV